MPRLAKSLVKLRNEINELFPSRKKSSDGWISDAAHRARKSEHNPDADGVVRAIDLTHDPKSGADMHIIADYLVRHKHPALWYMIFNGRIASSKNNFKWLHYAGVNPHNKHMHVSVKGKPFYDNESEWFESFIIEQQGDAVKVILNDKLLPIRAWFDMNFGRVFAMWNEIVEIIKPYITNNGGKSGGSKPKKSKSDYPYALAAFVRDHVDADAKIEYKTQQKKLYIYTNTKGGVK